MNKRFVNCKYLVEKNYLTSLFLMMSVLCFTNAHANAVTTDNSPEPKGAFSFTEKLPEVIDLTWNRGMIPDIGELSHSGSSLNILNIAKSCEIERGHELLNEEKCLKWSISYNHNHFRNKMILYVKGNDFFIQINNKIYPCYITIARMYNKKTGILEYGQFDPANSHFKSCNNGDWVAIINYNADGWVANLYFSFKNYRLYYHGFDFTSEMLLPFI